MAGEHEQHKRNKAVRWLASVGKQVWAAGVTVVLLVLAGLCGLAMLPFLVVAVCFVGLMLAVWLGVAIYYGIRNS